MAYLKRPLVRLFFSLILTVSLVSGGRDVFAQTAGAILNPAQQPNTINPGTDQNLTFNPSPFQNPFLSLSPTPNVTQSRGLLTPTVNPNAIGITDPLGNPYPFVNPNPITNPNVVTPTLTPNMVPTVTPNSSTLPNQGIGAGQLGTTPGNVPNLTGTGIVGGLAGGGAGSPSAVGGRGFDQIVE